MLTVGLVCQEGSRVVDRLKRANSEREKSLAGADIHASFTRYATNALEPITQRYNRTDAFFNLWNNGKCEIIAIAARVAYLKMIAPSSEGGAIGKICKGAANGSR